MHVSGYSMLSHAGLAPVTTIGRERNHVSRINCADGRRLWYFVDTAVGRHVLAVSIQRLELERTVGIADICRAAEVRTVTMIAYRLTASLLASVLIIEHAVLITSWEVADPRSHMFRVAVDLIEVIVHRSRRFVIGLTRSHGRALSGAIRLDRHKLRCARALGCVTDERPIIATMLPRRMVGDSCQIHLVVVVTGTAAPVPDA